MSFRIEDILRDTKMVRDGKRDAKDETVLQERLLNDNHSQQQQQHPIKNPHHHHRVGSNNRLIASKVSVDDGQFARKSFGDYARLDRNRCCGNESLMQKGYQLLSNIYYATTRYAHHQEDNRYWNPSFYYPNCMMMVDASNYAKRKGGQVRFSTSQTDALEKRFVTHKYLSPEDRKLLADNLKLSDRQVKTWFQNRRAKWRRIHNVSSSSIETGNDSESELETYNNNKRRGLKGD